MSVLSLPFKDGRRLTVRRGENRQPGNRVHVKLPARTGPLPSPEAAPTHTPEAATQKVEDSAPVVGAPKRNATRAAWRDYAESLGVETEGLTIAQIQEAVEETETDG